MHIVFWNIYWYHKPHHIPPKTLDFIILPGFLTECHILPYTQILYSVLKWVIWNRLFCLFVFFAWKSIFFFLRPNNMYTLLQKEWSSLYSYLPFSTICPCWDKTISMNILLQMFALISANTMCPHWGILYCIF